MLAARVIAQPDGPVGYIALYTFSEPARTAWAQAIATVRAAGANRLVVDLRDNSGGRLDVAAAVAASLAPPGASDATFVELRHGPRRSASDRSVPFPTGPTAGFAQVAWIVSEASCSAAEALIAGLRPYRTDVVIGTRTCGKPVGFDPVVRGEVVLNAVTFSVRNRDGLTDWFDGLSPTCPVAAEPWLPLGDPADPRLAEALRMLSTGACANDPTAAKAAPAPARSPERAAGLPAETGLW